MKQLLLGLFIILNVSFFSYKQEIALKPIDSPNTIKCRVSFYNNLTFEIKNEILLAKLKPIANSLRTQPEYLYAVIYHESHGHTTALNNNTNAVGLIQFMPSTLKGYNLTYHKVLLMTLDEQLILIKKYYSSFKNYNLNNPIKLFLCTFYPYGLKVWSNNDYIFGSEQSLTYASKIAKVNKGFDLNSDGYITMAEYKLYHYNLLKTYK